MQPPRAMRGEHFYGQLTVRKRRAVSVPPAGRRGVAGTGQVTRLFVGQGYGYIRVAPDDREVYFHRADLHADGRFNELVVGARVAFELFSDAVSGPRALRVRRCE
jgi:cold shock CspA family protein